MTHPLTPREKVRQIIDGALNSAIPELWEVANHATDRVFTALASGSGDHAELARLAEAAEHDPEYDGRSFEAAANPATVLALLAEIAALRAERDTAQSAVEAWAHVCESLEAHLQDRVALQDVADPERYLRILRSNIARVQKDSEQIRASRWADYRRHETRATEAERALSEHRIAADLLVSSLKSDKAEAERELGAVSSAIGTVRFMDPPDGGDVPLSEQVRRMASALTEAERKLAEAVGLVERSIDLMTDEYADTKAYREEARALISKEAEGE